MSEDDETLRVDLLNKFSLLQLNAISRREFERERAGQTSKEAARKLLDLGLRFSMLTEWEKSFLLHVRNDEIKSKSIGDGDSNIASSTVVKDNDENEGPRREQLPPPKPVISKRSVASDRLRIREKAVTWLQALTLAQKQSYVDPYTGLEFPNSFLSTLSNNSQSSNASCGEFASTSYCIDYVWSPSIIALILQLTESVRSRDRFLSEHILSPMRSNVVQDESNLVLTSVDISARKQVAISAWINVFVAGKFKSRTEYLDQRDFDGDDKDIPMLDLFTRGLESVISRELSFPTSSANGELDPFESKLFARRIVSRMASTFDEVHDNIESSRRDDGFIDRGESADIAEQFVAVKELMQLN